MRPKLILITGSSGVGKSSLAMALQEVLLPVQWLHFSADTLFYCLPRSVAARADQHNDWAAIDSNALAASAHACVRTLLERGHTVIFDAVVVARKGEESLTAAFGDYQPLRVSLHCEWNEIQRRTLTRGDRTIDEARHSFLNAITPTGSHHAFDTTHRTAQAIAVELAALVLRESGAA